MLFFTNWTLSVMIFLQTTGLLETLEQMDSYTLFLLQNGSLGWNENSTLVYDLQTLMCYVGMH